jgi:hypothetical protein
MRDQLHLARPLVWLASVDPRGDNVRLGNQKYHQGAIRANGVSHTAQFIRALSRRSEQKQTPSDVGSRPGGRGKCGAGVASALT